MAAIYTLVMSLSLIALLTLTPGNNIYRDFLYCVISFIALVTAIYLVANPWPIMIMIPVLAFCSVWAWRRHDGDDFDDGDFDDQPQPTDWDRFDAERRRWAAKVGL